MADPQTLNIGLAVPTRGSDPGTWDVPLNGDWTITDGMLAGVQAISAAGSSPITLTSPTGYIPTPSGGPTQSQNAVLRFTGVLTGNVQITLPLPGFIIIENLTTGAFVLSFRSVGSGEIIAVQQGSCRHIYNDGTNVRFVNLPDVGTYIDIAAATVPSWITSCTKPPYLNCDGSTFSATTYPYLNTFLGGNTLPDHRGVARYGLNQGTARLTSASGLNGDTLFSLKATQTNIIQTVNLPPYTPAGSLSGTALIKQDIYNGTAFGPGIGGFILLTGPNGTGSGIAAQSISGSLVGTPQGGTSTPLSTVATGVVSGITLIRAA